MTFGMITDYIIAYNNDHLNDEEKEDTVRVASQSDFNNF